MTSIRADRILVTRLRFLGDVILTTPVLDHLRDAFPGASIEYLVEEDHAPILLNHPSLDRIHTLPRRARWTQTWKVVRELRSPRVDWWIDLFANPRSTTLAWLCRPRHSVGSKRGLRSRVFDHRRERPRGDRSALRHHLDKLVPLLGDVSTRLPTLGIRSEEIENARRRFGGESPVVLHPGSTWPDKAWPRHRWVELLGSLQTEAPIAVVSPPGETGLAEWIARHDARATALPEFSLRELLAVVATASLFVGNDGGILHASVALGVPSVGVFGPTEPDIWFPYADHGPFRVVRRVNALGHCETDGQIHTTALAHLGVDEVLRAIHEVSKPRAREVSGA